MWHSRTWQTSPNLRWDANNSFLVHAILGSHLRFGLVCNVLQCNIYGDTLICTPLCELWRLELVVRPKIMFFNICKFHLQFWQMCKLFANNFFSLNTYFYSFVWIIMVHSNFDAKNLLLICLRISPQIFAIVPNFPNNFLRDQHFCTPLCEFGRLVMVLFTGNALEVEVPPGMVCIVWHWGWLYGGALGR